MTRVLTALRRALARLMATAGALGFAGVLTLAVFLVLPFLEQVKQQKKDEVLLREVGTASLAPPPPAAEEQKAEEKEEEPPPPPDLSEEAPPLDLSQLEMALNPGMGEGIGDFAIRLPGAAENRSAAASENEANSIFSLNDLDQTPRVVVQPAPQYPQSLKRKKISGTVHVLFIVDRSGRVTSPLVQKSTNQAFDESALQAVNRWRFEPGKRNGQAVSFRMRVPITFMAG